MDKIATKLAMSGKAAYRIIDNDIYQMTIIKGEPKQRESLTRTLSFIRQINTGYYEKLKMKGGNKMNNNIKQKIEDYVMEEFKSIKALDPTEDGYRSAKSSSIKDINILVELLQKEDVNDSNIVFNNSKIKNELEKIVKEHELNIKKYECEVKKNKDTVDLEKEKINKGYEIDYKKLENEIAKIDNEMVKINKDYELNDRKIQCDIDKLKNDMIKIDKDYEINKEKNKIDSSKNKDNLHIENRKIDSSEIKNNEDSDLKREELKINARKDIELRSDRIIKLVIDGVTIIVPVIFYNVWMNRGFIFEETGTFTSNTFKNMWSRFKPNK